MRMAWTGLVLAVVLWPTTGCGILGLDGEVEVRVRNGSDLTLDEATLFLPRGDLFFSDLSPGEASPYVDVPKAYRIASAEVVIGQDTARAQVIDYVGETPLKAGKYTYVFRVFEGSPSTLGVEFEKDS
jgi:hypothetical protein